MTIPSTPLIGLPKEIDPFLQGAEQISRRDWPSYPELRNETNGNEEIEKTPKLTNAPSSQIYGYQRISFRNLGEILWMVAFLPVLSFSFLGFCYAVHYRDLVIDTSWLDPSIAQINTVKAGITTISIMIISLALLPLYTLLSTLKGEEFFRILMQERGGVPLSTVNNVSTPAYSLYHRGIAILRRQSSGLFASAFVATLIVFAASALAPAILSAERVQVDEDLVALRVGAVLQNTVINVTERYANWVVDSVFERGYQMSALPWMEVITGSNYKWMAPPLNPQSNTIYAIPTPLNITLGTPVRYLTDVMAITPTCRWETAEAEYNSTVMGGDGVLLNTTMINLPNAGSSGIRIDTSKFMMSGKSFALELQRLGTYAYYRGKPSFEMEWYPLTDGSTVWVLQKCDPAHRPANETCYVHYDPTKETKLDITGLPTLLLGHSKKIDLCFLVCSPNLEVETREVVIDETDRLSLRPHPVGGHARQRNLDVYQSRFLIMEAMSSIAISSGPKPPIMSSLGFNLGGLSQIALVFGDVATRLTLEGQTIRPIPINEITINYARTVQSVLKGFLDGSIASRYVPARVRKPGLVFATSLPHLIVSTVLFVGLAVFLVLCHFREPVPQFTLVSLAASMSGSECPDILKDHQLDNDVVLPEKTTLNLLKTRKIALEGMPGQSRAVLRMTS